MPRATREEERLTEDDITRRELGPRGVPDDEDTAKMTKQEKKTFPRQAASTAIPPDYAKVRSGAPQPIPPLGRPKSRSQRSPPILRLQDAHFLH